MSLANPFDTLRSLDATHFYYALPELEKLGAVSQLPVSIRIMLEALLRNCDGKRVTEEDIKRLVHWDPQATGDVPFCVSRVILQDFTGVPLLVDLAAMRDAIALLGKDPKLIEPQVPVDLVIDHSVQVDRSATKDAFQYNLDLEFKRNQERYEFLKWGQEAFDTFTVIPPGIGIVHQVNLEHIATVVSKKALENGFLLFPDTLVGTDSHTTMINGLGVVGWGVGGIEAEAAMLNQPVSMQTPEVIGFCLEGTIPEGVTATDLTLHITEILRKEKVVGKFVEFFGTGVESLTVADRATIGNMAPEYGATMGFFPVDQKTIDYLRMTGRKESDIALIEAYLKAQNLFGIPKKGELRYTKVVELDLSTLKACVAGPKRPQDRISLTAVKSTFQTLLQTPIKEGGYAKSPSQLTKRIQIHQGGFFEVEEYQESGGTRTPTHPAPKKETWSQEEMVTNRPFTSPKEDEFKKAPSDGELKHGSIVIAAITSCTNTSNPSVMLAAGLLAKKAVEKGLKVHPLIKTSLAPGSRVVTDYLQQADLQKYLDALGFQIVAYGCTTCIGNSGPLDVRIEHAIKEHDLVTASVLSGNRNFEARIHSSVKANFLMSPPLVVAFALAGRVDIDLENESLGFDKGSKPVFLKDIWPSSSEIEKTMESCINPKMFQTRYAHILKDNPIWDTIEVTKSAQYNWDPSSTYIRKPPYFENFTQTLPPRPSFENMRSLALLGDSITTDHISPAGAFKHSSAAGLYLQELGVKEVDFNSYGSRRGNHEVMMRGTFANVRIQNKMAEGKEGGFTKYMPDGCIMSLFDASMEYQKKNISLIVFAGKDYGMGSSRDWAAKGTMLLGIKVVVARSFERIHRSNLIGMGILPLRFQEGASWESLDITGEETFSLIHLPRRFTPKETLTLLIEGTHPREVPLISCIDTPIEVDYFEHGGILPYVLRRI